MIEKVVLNLTLLSFVFLLVPVMNSSKLDTRGRPYKANFTFNLYDILGASIESMLDLTFIDSGQNYKSNVLSTESNHDVQWYFRATYHSGLFFYLKVAKLPENFTEISGTAECGAVDAQGNKIRDDISNKTVKVGEYIGAYSYKKPKSIPDLQYQVYCDVDAVLISHSKSNENMSPEEENLDEATKMELDRALKCRKELVRDTLNMLMFFNGTVKRNVELKSYDRSVTCHSRIVSKRMPLLEIPEKYNMFRNLEYDFSEELGIEQVRDLVNFMYWGNLNNPRKSCEYLFEVAHKYGFECLKTNCEKVLMEQIKQLI